MQKKLYDFLPSRIEGTRVYQYEGRVLELRAEDLCPDCSSPTVWMDDDENGNPVIGQVYHDRSCIQVLMGKGESLQPERKELPPFDVRIKQFIRDHPNSTTEEIARGAGVSQRTVRRMLGVR
ncbi:hypothetical protein A4G30_16170 [Mycobacterium kansasii]|uniref:Uncharacterized protein n=1 Tax=Mycobacterium kansasii TaxID=1768 RepID=A0A653F5N6_MYCKA|nr:hypothetical protein [Mycobacterium kansasii]ARG75778.1 hypothetical protein B1T51_16395 [Mycobacterium kansasii]ARG81317.1 hypothetical protein B1T52_16855 [Mycobacterium kansasii]ARG93406.1 hypothetical protein B1T50_17265 [Mycobacterium kansasii]KZS76312.1 hypothetical protein A4G30_16170 [Mycobacterium kansasii]VTP05085.1 hypothetical protein BIN_B_04927 [Mycobacterium kansasii]